MGKKLVIKGADFSASPVVAEYTLLDYIEAANTTQFINSGITLANNTIYEAEVSLKDLSAYTTNSYCGVMGTQGGNSASLFNIVIRIASEGTRNFRGENGNGIAVNSVVSDTNKHKVYLSSSDFKVDNVSKATSSSSEPTRSSTIPIGLMNTMNSATTAKYTSGNVKFHSFKITQSGVVVLDAIPVKRNSDNVICLYDKITSTYLTTNDGVNPLFGTK